MRLILWVWFDFFALYLYFCSLLYYGKMYAYFPSTLTRLNDFWFFQYHFYVYHFYVFFHYTFI